MTRKEAIKILKSKMDGTVDTSYEWAETIRLAINALSAIEDIKQEIWTSHKDNYCKSEIVNLIDKYLKGEIDDYIR